MAQPATAPNTADTRPSPTAQGRVSDSLAPATAFIQVDWTANVSIDGGAFVPVSWASGCSGFVVDPDGLIVTAGHCLDPGWDEGGARRTAAEMVIQDAVDRGTVTPEKGSELLDEVVAGTWQWRIEGQLNDSAPDRRVHVTIGGGGAPWNADPKAPPTGIEATVLDVKPWSEGDVGLLKIERKNLPIAVLAPEEAVQIGQEVMAIGYPLELADPQQSSGNLALTNRTGNIEAVDTTGQHGPGNQFYSVSAAPVHGMSGGPVSNLQSQVVGLSSTMIGNSTSFIVPSSVVTSTFGDRIHNTLGHVDELYRQGLADYYSGYYTDAIAEFDQVLQLVPDLPAVTDKKVDAAQRRDRFGDQPKPLPPAPPAASRTPLYVMAGGAAAVVLALVLLGIVLVRRRRRPSRADVLVPVPPAGDDDTTTDGVAEPSEPEAPETDGLLVTTADVPVAANGRRPHHDETDGSVRLTPAPVVLDTRPHGADLGFCRSCGTPHDPRDAFCSRCGADLRRT